jgi:hypothetical protein
LGIAKSAKLWTPEQGWPVLPITCVRVHTAYNFDEQGPRAEDGLTECGNSEADRPEDEGSQQLPVADLAQGKPAEIDSKAVPFSVRVLVLVSNFPDSALAEFAAHSVEGSRPVLCPATRRGHKGQHASGTHLRVVSIGTSLLSEVALGSRLNATRPSF